MEIRSMKPDEHERVAAIVLQAYDALHRIDGDYRREMGDPAARMTRGTDVLVAGAADGRVVGTVTWTDHDSPYFEAGRDGDCGFRLLAVAPEAQGMGVGRALVEHCIARARGLGRHRLLIHSVEWMTRAQALYQSLDFVRRPDLDVRFDAGVGRVFTLDLSATAASAFPAPGEVPDEVPWYADAWEARARPPVC